MSPQIMLKFSKKNLKLKQRKSHALTRTVGLFGLPLEPLFRQKEQMPLPHLSQFQYHLLSSSQRHKHLSLILRQAQMAALEED